MEANNKISLGALTLSIISMIVTVTALVVGGTRDISNIKDLLGTPGSSNGLYGIVNDVRQDAESANLIAKHARTISEESRNLSNDASQIATEAKGDTSIVEGKFAGLEEECKESHSNSDEAVIIANKALSFSKFDLPVGAIIAWNPKYRDETGVTLLRDLPDGWAVCNGVNGTPNLVDRFLMGVAETTQADKLAGNNEISSAGHHAHSYSIVQGGGLASPSGFDTKSPNNHTANHNTGVGGSHSHGDNRPAYYAVVFVMKVK